MAIIIPGVTQCPICKETLAESDDLVTTTHFIADEEDTLWPYSDSAIHRDCFLGWELRESFVDRFNRYAEQQVSADGQYEHMQADGTVIPMKGN